MEKHKKKKVLLCVIAVIVCAVLIGFGWNFYTFYALETFGYTEMEEVAKTMSNLANGQTSKVSLTADDEMYAVFVSDSENEQQAPAAFILRELPFGFIQKTGRYKVIAEETDSTAPVDSVLYVQGDEDEQFLLYFWSDALAVDHIVYDYENSSGVVESKRVSANAENDYLFVSDQETIKAVHFYDAQNNLLFEEQRSVSDPDNAELMQ